MSSDAYAEIVQSRKGGYPLEVWKNGFLYATRMLRCAWEDRYAVLTNIGLASYPYNTAVDAYPIEAEIEGVGVRDGTGPIADYDQAWLTVKYSSELSIVPTTGLLVSERTTPFSIQIGLDPDGFCWESQTGPPLKTQPPSKIIRGIEYIVTFRRVNSIPAAATTMAGYINSGTLTSYLLGVSFPAGTVLYGGATAELDTYLGTTPKKCISYQFLCHPAGWNKHFRPATCQFEDIYHAKYGLFVNYPSGNFASLVPS